MPSRFFLPGAAALVVVAAVALSRSAPPRPGPTVHRPASVAYKVPRRPGLRFETPPPVAAAPSPTPLSLRTTAASLDTGELYARGTEFQQWAEHDLKAATGYVEKLPPGNMREEAMGRLALVVTQWIPEDGADIVATEMSPGPSQDEAAISVLHQWALLDPVAAQQWAAAFPPGALRERALREVAGVAALSAARLPRIEGR